MKFRHSLALASSLLLALACGSDDSGPAQDDGLDNADQLTSSSGETCPEVADGTDKCVTTAEDVSAYRALAAGECGIDLSGFGFPGCVELDQPGEVTESCPDVDFGGGAPPAPGCCASTGVCGALDEFFGMGCTRNPDPSTHVACGG